MKEASKEFQEMISQNRWHDVEELDHFVAVIKKLSAPPRYTENV